MTSAPGQIQPARGGMAEGHVGRRIARGCDKGRDCAPPTDPDPGVVTPVCERRSANRSATQGRGLVGAQALERHQMHSEAGAGARAGSVLTHRVGGQGSGSDKVQEAGPRALALFGVNEGLIKGCIQKTHHI